MSSKYVETNLDEGVLNNSEWVQRWTDGDVDFHSNTHESFLDKKEEEIFGGKIKSVFVPLCGKSVDMLWMYNHGHTVCGVEIAEQAVKDFFVESNLEYISETVQNVGNVYKSKDGRLCLYAADIFDVNVELCGQFDVIWDNKSFVAINKCDRQQYSDLLLSLLKKDGLYYMSTIEYDPAVWPGPPHSVTNDVIQTFFSDSCNIVTEEEETTQTNAPELPSNVSKSDKTMLGIGSSSFICFKWYKMSLKNS